MTKTVVLVTQYAGERDDRASRLLGAHGYRLQWVCPKEGEELPDPGPDHAGAVVYGGPESVNDADKLDYLRREIDWTARWIAAEKPFFGICLGGQILARALGAEVARHPEGEHQIGFVEIEPTPASNGFLAGPMHVYHWHNEGFEVPAGGELLASGPAFPNQAYRYGRSAYGIQFHPEATPDIFARWIEQSGHMLDCPGAHPAERQKADGARYDPAMGAWLEGFLARWIKGD
jgi:GMP synthase (glutamine-hydrolysing)